jgi:hypothetical protein
MTRKIQPETGVTDSLAAGQGNVEKDRELSAASIIGEPGAFGERLDWSSAPSSG